MKRKFTIVTELRKSQNMKLIAYLDLCFADYGKAKRETFHKIKNSNRFDKSKHNTFLQTKYDGEEDRKTRREVGREKGTSATGEACFASKLYKHEETACSDEERSQQMESKGRLSWLSN